MKSEKMQPSDFMRARHPELFSDSLKTEDPMMSRTYLDFHLENLTINKEEIRFEHLCRHLAQKEICPNLSPQTGPTGGGDSKVDAENYPVANSIAERWYVGNPDKSSQERWAFAFSAKKNWRPKIAEDVQKIAETNRGYTLIYFMTNQPIKDSAKAKMEDSLSKQWNVSIRILDRNWISTKIVENNRWDIACQTLDIDIPYQERLVLGPLDTERKESLKELDRKIEQSSGNNFIGPQLVEDCLTSAILARGLGLPRTEIDGRFTRAERMAKDYGISNQQVRVLYQRAWTAYWWFDDLGELDHIYQDIENLTLENGSIWDLEKLGNLLMAANFRPSRMNDKYEEEKWQRRTTDYLSALEKHSNDRERPTGMLLARTQILLLKLPDSFANRDRLSTLMSELKEITKAGRKRLDYPFESVVQLVEELSNVVNNPSLDDLFEYLIDQSSKRSGETSEGKLRLTRGVQKLNSDKTYEAIDQFAKASTLLAKNENVTDFLKALTGTAISFEAAGLFWAARGYLLIALERALYFFDKNGEMIPQALLMANQLVWTELQLGRIPCAISSIEILNGIAAMLDLTEDGKKNFREEYECIDATLAALFLRTRFEDLKQLCSFHKVLQYLSLFRSRAALLFCLGNEEAVKKEIENQDIDLDKLFSEWLNVTQDTDIPKEAQWYSEQKISLNSFLMGCEIQIHSTNSISSIMLSEAILAFLESLLSTAITLKEHFSLRPLLKITLTAQTEGEQIISHEVVEDECGETEIFISFSESKIAADNSNNFDRYLLTLATAVIQELHVPFSKESIKQLLIKDKALERSALCANSYNALKTLIGDSPKYKADNWKPDSEDSIIQLLRNEPWVSTDKIRNESNTDRDTQNKVQDEFSRFGIDGLRHRDLKVKSAINMPLWNRANWHSTGYLYFPDGPELHLVLVFRDAEAGRKIFRGWIRQVGNVDNDEHIKVALITGINKKNLQFYRVVITTNEKEIFDTSGESKPIACVYRMNDMEPSDSKNLDMFKTIFEKTKSYKLTLGHSYNQKMVFNFEEEFSIMKKDISIVPAWSIKPTDLLCGAIGKIDNPFIPEGEVDVPFIECRKVLQRAH